MQGKSSGGWKIDKGNQEKGTKGNCSQKINILLIGGKDIVKKAPWGGGY